MDAPSAAHQTRANSPYWMEKLYLFNKKDDCRAIVFFGLSDISLYKKQFLTDRVCFAPPLTRYAGALPKGEPFEGYDFRKWCCHIRGACFGLPKQITAKPCMASAKGEATNFVGTGGLLRFGHARVLTTHRVVIHCARAASLPRLSAIANE